MPRVSPERVHGAAPLWEGNMELGRTPHQTSTCGAGQGHNEAAPGFREGSENFVFPRKTS